MPATEMKDHVYKILELVGSSEKGIDDAIHSAIARASKTIPRSCKREGISKMELSDITKSLCELDSHLRSSLARENKGLNG
jgi:flavin-binding protein dodecin